MADDLASRLDEIEARYEAVQAELASPQVAADPDRLRTLGKTFSELEEVVRPYREYRAVLGEAEDARGLAAAEGDGADAAFYAEEAERAEVRAAELRAALERLLVPKDPDDGKDLIVEIRAGAGGQEAALWAGELFEMYRRLA